MAAQQALAPVETKPNKDSGMNIVIIGGHDRMVCNYKDICKQYCCKAKVFTQMPNNMKGVFGNPDLMVLFTSTVSHQMVNSAMKCAKNSDIKIVRSHSSSSCALKTILDEHCGGCCPHCPKKAKNKKKGKK